MTKPSVTLETMGRDLYEVHQMSLTPRQDDTIGSMRTLLEVLADMYEENIDLPFSCDHLYDWFIANDIRFPKGMKHGELQ